MMNTPRPDRVFIGTAALVFVASSAVTIAWCGSMSAMPGMAMPGGWTMSMAWMRMPGQSWSGAAATFLGMWLVMMIAMMLPSLAPMLSRYRRATGNDSGPLTMLVGASYFFVWTLCGVVMFPLGLAFAEVAMRMPALARVVPIAAGIVVVVSGLVQITAWKMRQLACCRTTPLRGLPANSVTAWRHGLRLGVRCLCCCAPLTAALLVIGVMDLRAMALLTAAVTAERLAPAGERTARVIGAIVIATGLVQMATAFARG
jgi:predicted metal-binding membrane protein